MDALRTLASRTPGAAARRPAGPRPALVAVALIAAGAGARGPILRELSGR